MEPKIPEVSSGFPRGTSERLQAWSQQIQRTVVGNWVIIKNFLKNYFPECLSWSSFLPFLQPKQLWWQWCLLSDLKSKDWALRKVDQQFSRTCWDVGIWEAEPLKHATPKENSLTVLSELDFLCGYLAWMPYLYASLLK